MKSIKTAIEINVLKSGGKFTLDDEEKKLDWKIEEVEKHQGKI